jgi:hypothetical protein
MIRKEERRVVRLVGSQWWCVLVLFLVMLPVFAQRADGSDRKVYIIARITAIDHQTGMVTAKVEETGQILEIGVKNASLLKSLEIGRELRANLQAKQVYLDDKHTQLAGTIMKIR